MKITDVKPYPVWVAGKNQLLVKVETDEGLYGWGESGLSTRDLAVAGAVKHYREWLIGRDPMRIGALWQEMYRSQYFEGGRALHGGHLGHRPCPLRHQGQGPECARVRAPRRQAARLCALLCHHRRRPPVTSLSSACKR